MRDDIKQIVMKIDYVIYGEKAKSIIGIKTNPADDNVHLCRIYGQLPILGMKEIASYLQINGNPKSIYILEPDDDIECFFLSKGGTIYRVKFAQGEGIGFMTVDEDNQNSLNYLYIRDGIIQFNNGTNLTLDCDFISYLAQNAEYINKLTSTGSLDICIKDYTFSQKAFLAPSGFSSF